MENRYSRQSIYTIALSLVLIVGCSDSGKDPLAKLAGVEGHSFCETINKVFYIALDTHLTKSRSDAPDVYTKTLQELLNRPMMTRDRENLEERILPRGKADLARLEDCSDLVAIQNAWNDNPTYSGENRDADEDTSIHSVIVGKSRHEQQEKSNTLIFHHFLWALTKNLDNYSYYRPRLGGSSGEGAFDFGVRLDIDAELEYDVDKIERVRVAAVKDQSQNLRQGDEIVAVEWQASQGRPRRLPLKDISLKELKGFLSQNRMDSVTVYVERKKSDGTAEEVGITLKGEKKFFTSEMSPLVTGELQGNIIYVKLYSFEQTAALQISNLISAQKEIWMKERLKANDTKADPQKDLGIILDLRFNPGGDVSEALRIAGLFMPYQQIGAVRSNTGDIPAYVINTGVVFENPMAVLVNHASASSSEILSQILLESGRAILLGETTFGKLIGQSGFELGVGGVMEGMIFITSIRFFGPKGDNRQLAGITPTLSDRTVAQHRAWKQTLATKCESKNVSDQRHCIFRMSDWAKIPGGKSGLIEAAPSIGIQGKTSENAIALKMSSFATEQPIDAAVQTPLVTRDEVTSEASKVLVQFMRSTETQPVPTVEEKPFRLMQTNLSTQSLQMPSQPQE